MQPNEQPTEMQVPEPVQAQAPVAQPGVPVQQAPMTSPAAPAMQQQPMQDQLQPVQPPADDGQTIQWQAPEYLSGDRSPLWFLAFWGAVIVLMIIAALLIKSWTFVILIPVMAAALMIYTHRPARPMTYVVSAKGLYINQQIHPLPEFRHFSVMQDEAMPALIFTPIKRLRPNISVYFPGEIGEQLVDFLGARLPMQQAEPDVFDRVVRKLHL